MSNDTSAIDSAAVWGAVEAVQDYLRTQGLAGDVQRGRAPEAIAAASDLLRVFGVEPVIDPTAGMALTVSETWPDQDDRRS